MAMNRRPYRLELGTDSSVPAIRLTTIRMMSRRLTTRVRRSPTGPCSSRTQMWCRHSAIRLLKLRLRPTRSAWRPTTFPCRGGILRRAHGLATKLSYRLAAATHTSRRINRLTRPRRRRAPLGLGTVGPAGLRHVQPPPRLAAEALSAPGGANRSAAEKRARQMAAPPPTMPALPSSGDATMDGPARAACFCPSQGWRRRRGRCSTRRASA